MTTVQPVIDRFLDPVQDGNIIILRVNLDEYKELQNGLLLLSKRRQLSKAYYWKQKNQTMPVNKTAKISILLPELII